MSVSDAFVREQRDSRRLCPSRAHLKLSERPVGWLQAFEPEERSTEEEVRLSQVNKTIRIELIVYEKYVNE